jgi:uncharacterized protein YjbI with pentapeptide repeats
LTFANLAGVRLWDATFISSNLTRAYLYRAELDRADFSGAIVNWTSFGDTTPGFTKEQLYATASYQRRDLQQIELYENDLTGWNFSNQNLSDAGFWNSILTDVNFAGAIVVRASFGRPDPPRVGALTKEQLYSTASYQQGFIQGISLDHNDLTGWDFYDKHLNDANFGRATLVNTNFASAELSGASFSGATLTNANFSGAGASAYFQRSRLINANFSRAYLQEAVLQEATLTGANFSDAFVSNADFGLTTSSGFTKEQLYSSASYKQKDLVAIQLYGNDLSGWNLSDQFLYRADLRNSILVGTDFKNSDLRRGVFTNANLTNAILASADMDDADFTRSNLSNADLSASLLGTAIFNLADLRGVVGFVPTPGTRIRNAILPDGTIQVFNLSQFGDVLTVRDSELAITASETFAISSLAGVLEFSFVDPDWGSTITIAPGVTPQLGGTLRLSFDPSADLPALEGATFDLFNWPAPLDPQNRFFYIELPQGSRWDLSELYTTGEIRLETIPEPTTAILAILATAAMFWGARARRRLFVKTRPTSGSS